MNREVRRTSLQLTWKYHRPFRTEQGESIDCSLVFRKTRIAKYADARTLQRRHAEEILAIGRTELNLPEDLAM